MANLGVSLESAFRGKRVLVTGHTGFKGSWLGLWLHELGATVCGFALAPRDPSHFTAVGLSNSLRHVDGDLRDRAAVRATIGDFSPDIVFHLAAQPLVRESYRDPATTFDVNVGGTVSILEAVRASESVKALVVVTSDKCYENREWDLAYREADPLGGYDPYSASKGAAEIVAHSYRRSFFESQGVALATARAGNVIGGGDWAADRIVPDCIRAVERGEPVVVRNPQSVRPWQHVLEPIYGYLLLGAALLKPTPGLPEAFNFGPPPGSTLNVGELAQELMKAWPEGRIIAPTSSEAGPHEAKFLRLASDRAADRLGWVPLLGPREAVRWASEWYRAWCDGNRASGAMRALSITQLRRYAERLAARE